jgi:outer membrane protein assembly factor BamB
MLNRGMSATRPKRLLQWLLGVIAMVILVLASAGSAFAEVTGGADNLRTGWYPDEPSLTPALLSGGGFQQVFKDSLQGQIYAQPLTADGVLLVATEDNLVYGLDPVTGAIRWKDEPSQLGTAVEAGEGKTINCTDLEPRVGITGTPVIDTKENIAYLVSNRYVTGDSGAIAWYMHAIKLDNGAEVEHFPVKIEGEAQNLPPGVKFEATQELQRPALLMMNGVIYAGFGSHCDHEPYEGWIVGVSTAGLLTTKWATSAHGGSIWQAGGGLISDGPGQILFSTGNDNFEAGVFDPPVGPGNAPPEGKFGESVVRTEVQPTGELKAKDFFSPFNNKELDEGDIDLGSSAPIALPSQYFGTPSVPDLLVQDGKDGHVYLLNRDNLGGMGQEGGKDKVVQELGPYGGVWDSSAVWPGDGGYVYIPSVAPGGSSGGSSNKLRFFKYEVAAGAPKLSLAATSPETFAFGSGSPIVTSNGTTSGTGVLWITRCPPPSCEKAELRAYNPVPLGKEALQVLWQAPIGTGNKFSRPDASNGHIYVGNREGDIFGYSGPALTPSSESLELGSAPVGDQLAGKVTFTNTGTKLTVKAVHAPSAQFEATGLPTVGSVIEPGEVITVNATFKSSTPGLFKGSLGLTTEAGETNIALSGSAEESRRSALTPSTESLELGSTLDGGQLSGEVRFANTGNTNLVVSAVHSPSAPFAATALPEKGAVIKPGQVITVRVAFETAAPGNFTGSLGLTTEAGETNVALSGSAHAPLPSEPPATSPESGGIATTASLLTPPGGPGPLTATTAPLVSLAHLQIRAAASRLGSHRRRVVVTYTLSAAGTVEVAIYRRVISRRCQRGASTCVRWVPTKIRLKVAGHAGINVLAVSLGTLSAGDYRMDAMPITSSGASGITQYLHFKAVR